MTYNEAADMAADVIANIAEAGNTVTLSIGGSVPAIVIDEWKEVEKRVGQAILAEAVGRMIILFLAPADAVTVMATPGTLCGWGGDQFTMIPHKEKTNANTPIYTYLLGHDITNLWPHRVDVYRKETAVSQITGIVGQPTFALIASNVLAYFGYTDNVDDPTDAGRIKRPSFFTRDVLSVPYNTNVVNADYLINKSTNPDGTATPLFGQIHVLQGAPKIHLETALLPFGWLELEGMSDENAPAALVTIAKAIAHTGSSYWDLLAA